MYIFRRLLILLGYSVVIGVLVTFVLHAMAQEQPNPQHWPVTHWGESGLIAFVSSLLVATIANLLSWMRPAQMRRRLR